ncbi:MAG: pyridoxamine 5'-phosphate oxidase family protein, partial [Anaerotruncus colihominis]
MFREMRRKKQELSRMESVALLERATSGVLAVLGDGDYPYAVPLSFVYYDEKLYFHCAVTGHKLDAVKRHPKASFCVIGQDHVLPEKYTTCFRSAIAFGRVRVLEDPAEKLHALELLAAKYSPGQAEGRRQ